MELFRLEYRADKTDDGTLYWCTWQYTKRFPSLSLELIRKAENKFMKSFYKINSMSRNALKFFFLVYLSHSTVDKRADNLFDKNFKCFLKCGGHSKNIEENATI